MRKINKLELKEVCAVLGLYGIDMEHIKISRDTVGFVNKIYFVNVGKKKLVLRKSNPITSLRHIKMEVDLLDYLQTNNFAATPKVISNLKGQDITIYNKAYFTLQNFMPGSIKASWNNVSGFTLNRARNFFQTVAKFGKAVENFSDSNGFHNKPLWYFVKNGVVLLDELYNNLPKSDGKNLVSENYKDVLGFIAQTKKEFIKINYESLPKQLVHFDFHPGNVNFLNNKVVAVFDFDWVRYDARFSDLASAIGQSCYYYGGKMSGKFKKDRIRLAIDSYQKAYGKSVFSRKEEAKYIEVATRGYAVYILFWAVDLYEKNPNQENFLVLSHFLKMMLANDYNLIFA